jgi:hypothetical protein
MVSIKLIVSAVMIMLGCFLFLADLLLQGDFQTKLLMVESPALRASNFTSASAKYTMDTGSSHLEYSVDTIIRLSKQLATMPGKLLIYDPAEDIFVIYTVSPDLEIKHREICPRCPAELRVMIRALKKLRPLRFQPVQPPFQLFWTDRDFTFTKCDPTHPSDCFTHPSWLHFGSYFRNRSLLPNIDIKPNFEYLKCVFEVQLNSTFGADEPCSTWKELFSPTDGYPDFEKLTPHIVWRGLNRTLLPHVGINVFVGNWSVPHIDFLSRLAGVGISKQNPKLMNIQFGSNSGKLRYNIITNAEQAKYKYQLDLGGTGGTTWTGTLEKLAMPGMLFHHETPAHDWYFDRMIPWKQYVPIRTDLSDLKTQFEWAESHPLEAKRIAEQGTEFARYMLSKRTLAAELERYFGEASLGQLVDAYQPAASGNDTLKSILQEYQSRDIHLAQVSWCSHTECHSKLKPSFTYTYSLSNRSQCSMKPFCKF